MSRIAIASVLKPLKDPRAYYRMALSLRETNKYRINIIGFSTKNKSNEENLKFYSVFCQKRTHWSRLFAGFRFLGILLKAPPKILIIGTYELIPFAILLKPFLKFKLVYDLQENYAANISHNKSLPYLIKHLAMGFVKVIEFCSKPFIDHYFFAEECYKDEFPAIRNFTVLENRFFHVPEIKDLIHFQSKSGFTFLISGTLTAVYGVIEGIRWFKKIKEQYPDSQLIIIGHVPVKAYKTRLTREVGGNTSISLQVSDYPVSYQAILDSYREADFCLMPYRLIPSISHKIPSKLYEAMALGVPALISPNKKWEMLFKPVCAGKSIDFSDLNDAVANFHSSLLNPYFTNPVPEKVFWKSQESSFLKIIATLLQE